MVSAAKNFSFTHEVIKSKPKLNDGQPLILITSSFKMATLVRPWQPLKELVGGSLVVRLRLELQLQLPKHKDR